VLAGLGSYLEALRRNLLWDHPGCWWTSVPCSGRLRFASLLALSWGPLHLQDSKGAYPSYSCYLTDFCFQPEKALSLKELIWLDQAHPESLYISQLITSMKLLLLCHELQYWVPYLTVFTVLTPLTGGGRVRIRTIGCHFWNFALQQAASVDHLLGWFIWKFQQQASDSGKTFFFFFFKSKD
jgi:hypothetical protein